MPKIIKKIFIPKRLDDGFVVLSDESLDSDGDIIRQDGWDFSRAKDNRIPMSYSHDTWSFPLGSWTELHVNDAKQLIAKPDFASEEDPVRAGVAKKLWDANHLRATSVGFTMPDGAEFKLIENQGREYVQGHQIYEAAICFAGANINAHKTIQKAVADGVITEEEAGRLEEPKAEPTLEEEFKEFKSEVLKSIEEIKSALKTDPPDPAGGSEGDDADKQKPPVDEDVLKDLDADSLAFKSDKEIGEIVEKTLSKKLADAIRETVSSVIQYQDGTLD